MKNLNFFVNEGAGVHLRLMNKKLSLNGAMGSGRTLFWWVKGGCKPQATSQREKTSCCPPLIF